MLEAGASQRPVEQAFQAPGAPPPFNSTGFPRRLPRSRTCSRVCACAHTHTHTHPHTHTHTHPPTLHTLTFGTHTHPLCTHSHSGLQRPWTHTLECLSTGTQWAGLPRGWAVCVATDWQPRRHLSNRCTRPLVLTDLSRCGQGQLVALDPFPTFTFL